MRFPSFLLILGSLLAGGTLPAQFDWQTFIPEPAPDRILKNGVQGIAYEIEELLPADHLPEWVLRSCSVIYWRLDWAEVCDENGRPIFEKLDREIFSGYRALGFKLAFRIMTTNQSTNARHVIPEAVIARFGIPTVTRATRFRDDQVCGIWWSPEFIAAHEELIAAFGAWFDGRPWAAQAELGAIGEWGEMHLGGWGANTLATHGWNATTFLRTTVTLMEQMERHLPRSTKAFCWAPIFNVDPDPAYAHLLRRALDRGWWLRSDGLNGDGPAPFVRLAYEPNRDRLALIGEGSIGRGGGPDDLAAWFRSNIEGGVALLNPMGTKALCALHPEIAEAHAPRFGPRLTIESARTKLVTAVNDRPPRLLLSLALRQDGNVPHFRPTLIEVEILSGGVRWAHREIIPATPVAAITPGTNVLESAVLELPGQPPQDRPLTLRIALADIDHGFLQLPHTGQDTDGWLTIGELSPILHDPAPEIRLLFSLPRDEWIVAEGVVTETGLEGVMIRSDRFTEAVIATGADRLSVRPEAIYQSHARYRVFGLSPAQADFFHWLDARGSEESLNGFLASPAYDGGGEWQDGTITHRPRPGDESLRPLFLGKGVRSFSAEIGAWNVEEILFPTLPAIARPQPPQS